MSIAIFDQLSSKLMNLTNNRSENRTGKVKNLLRAKINKEYRISDVVQENEEMVSFLFSLGCFKGESITLVSVLSGTYVISVKDARYSIDSELAELIVLE